tara:strand:- start:6197 stop:7273 length:1077 start_codon:yes stop_codon:yes gene_type:complete
VINSLIDKKDKPMLDGKDAVSALDLARDIAKGVAATRDGSLIEFTRATRVQPVTLVDQRAAQLPYIEEVLASGLNIFSAYYLQAVALSVDVGKVNVIKTLGRLNPNRDPLDSLGAQLSTESRALPFPGQELSQEDSAEGSARDVREEANLSIGKLLEVNIESNGNKAKFPINVRLMVNTVRSDILTHTLSLDSGKVSLKERYHKWRSGQIRFVQDLIMSQDLIDQHKKNLIEDASGYYKSRTASKRRNTLSALLSQDWSVATASSIFVIHQQTAKEIETKLRGKLDDFRTREKLFEETYGMLLFVIDPDWESVTVYHRSIEEATEVSIREIQRMNKSGKGPDIGEILNAFRQNKSPII